MERSRKLALTNWTLANDALVLRFAGNKSELTKFVKMSRTTVTAFFKGEPIREAEFRKICTALLLNWQEISAVSTDAEVKRDDSLEQIRAHCRDKILNNYSKIRLLSGQEIGVDQLYVDVWLLDRSPRTFQRSADKMLETFDLRNDRLGLGDRIKRNPGFDIANQESKLLILGKPGSGKTTFLKHLAIDWCKGGFQTDLIAVFIEFRQIRDNKWKLLDAIGAELEIQDKNQIEALLNDGKLLVLMDGFDEVATQSLRRKVQLQLGEVAKKYPNSRYVMTCRTQIMQRIPDGFAPVEVADFNNNQVQAFVRNWFRTNGQNEVEVQDKWRTFELAINKNPALKELTTTPVLLGLACFAMEDEGEIPVQVSSLYDRGIQWLLQKWNDDKAIEGWEMGTETYQKLDVGQKEKLLIEIAARKFENPKNFVLFEQADLIEQISQHLRMPSHDDARAVLIAMESQHGLLVERADGLWSFSHLTFQEHFTTKWLLRMSSEELSLKVSDERWQEVVVQLVISQGQSNRLIGLIKQAIDYSISNNAKAQEFLDWIYKKSKSNQALDQTYTARKINFVRAFAPSWAVDELLKSSFDTALNMARGIMTDLVLAPDCAEKIFWGIDVGIKIGVNIEFKPDALFEPFTNPEPEFDFLTVLDNIRNRDSSVTDKLEPLRRKLPVLFWDSIAEFESWWEQYGAIWTVQFCQVMFEYFNVMPSFKFDSQQVGSIESYYRANNFLIALLEIENAVSPEVRQEIEDNLLLPIAELKRRLPDQYGGIEED